MTEDQAIEFLLEQTGAQLLARSRLPEQPGQPPRVALKLELTGKITNVEVDLARLKRLDRGGPSTIIDSIRSSLNRPDPHPSVSA